jgi:hypothetical protein
LLNADADTASNEIMLSDGTWMLLPSELMHNRMHVRRVVIYARKVNDLMKEVLKLSRGSLTVKMHDVFKTAIEDWRALVKSYRKTTLTRLFRDVFSTSVTMKLDMTLCFDKAELHMLTRKDMTFTVHPLGNKHALAERQRQATAEVMRMFEDILFNVQVCCCVIRFMHDKFWSAQ